ncbi:MAG: hypothetical protein UY48_C0008G0043 [Candidatus Gottesmanbacteria bacterium GW2011_GWB1_49_7]|uniref:Uncharacterized protein n=1 Tax=Candidatus Gottesmanbacteria bacterium GW2011_GWB1_49_7 TaxID=1618448 RepID=A0A0G1W2C9_9BACT|nr:MAG: hypothetical protein UY48_C0008G0043 [Candidatus Gottesmanbacteria bacterium GW2011_GWB1_49_7]
MVERDTEVIRIHKEIVAQLKELIPQYQAQLGGLQMKVSLRTVTEDVVQKGLPEVGGDPCQKKNNSQPPQKKATKCNIVAEKGKLKRVPMATFQLSDEARLISDTFSGIHVVDIRNCAKLAEQLNWTPKEVFQRAFWIGMDTLQRTADADLKKPEERKQVNDSNCGVTDKQPIEDIINLTQAILSFAPQLEQEALIKTLQDNGIKLSREEIQQVLNDYFKER